jgi:hypothetical protein
MISTVLWRPKGYVAETSLGEFSGESDSPSSRSFALSGKERCPWFP